MGITAGVVAAPAQFKTVMEAEGSPSFAENGALKVPHGNVAGQKYAILADFMNLMLTPDLEVEVIDKARDDFRAALLGDQSDDAGAIDQWTVIFKDWFKTTTNFTGVCDKHKMVTNTIEVINHPAIVPTKNPMTAISGILDARIPTAPCNKPDGDKGEHCQLQLKDLSVTPAHYPMLMHVDSAGGKFSITVPRNSANLEVVHQYVLPDGKESAITYKLVALFTHVPKQKHWTAFIRYGDNWWQYDDTRQQNRIKIQHFGMPMEGDSALFVKNATI